MLRSIPLLAVLLAVPADGSETSGGPFLTLTCPAKGTLTRSFDLSTGVAPWVARGPAVPNNAALATAIDPASIPPGWSARVPGARWVQAMPVQQAAPHALGDFSFTLEFDLPKGPRRPRLRLEGQIAGDEGFDLNLTEPTPPNSWIGGGPAMMDDSPGLVTQDEVQPVLLDKSSDNSGRPLGMRSGRYVLQITAPNAEAAAAQVGLLARLKLTMTCGRK